MPPSQANQTRGRGSAGEPRLSAAKQSANAKRAAENLAAKKRSDEKAAQRAKVGSTPGKTK
jgi:hypothetical protein